MPVSAVGDLVILVEPMATLSVVPVFAPAEEPSTQLVAETGLVLALGDQYPNSLELELTEPWFLGTNCVRTVPGTGAIRSVSVDGTGLRAEPRGMILGLALEDEGTFEMLVEGRFTPDDPSLCPETLGSGRDFELTLTVSVRRPIGAVLELPAR
ncbi:MAG TPA: hypothetical protein VGB13_03970, partial [Candidatus Krumholzibacteria bacterium]